MCDISIAFNWAAERNSFKRQRTVVLPVAVTVAGIRRFHVLANECATSIVLVFVFCVPIFI